MSHTANVIALTTAISGAGVTAALTSHTTAGLCYAGTGMAVAFVIGECYRDTGKPRSLGSTATKIISTVICGLTLPGIIQKVFQSNSLVQDLEGVWQIWALSAFLCGIFGWSIIFTARTFFHRAVDKAAHSRAVEILIGPDATPAEVAATSAAVTVAAATKTAAITLPADVIPAPVKPSAP